MYTIDLKRFRRANKMTQVQAAAYFGCEQSFISLIETGRSKTPEGFISKILADDNIDSSMVRKEEEVKNEEQPFIITKSGIKYYRLAENRYRMRVPFVQAHAYAKYIDERQDAVYWTPSEEYEFLVDKIHHGSYMAFEIKGDSMDDDSKRSLSDGDIVLARELNRELWKSRLHTDDFPNWIIVLDDTILCKQIIDQNLENGDLICHSLNPSREYADFKVNLNEVRQLFNIVQRVSLRF